MSSSQSSETIRNALPRRGPHTFAIVPADQLAWPMSNLDPTGCKHDVTRYGDATLTAGLPWPCEKCGCLLIPDTTARRELARFEGDWRPTQADVERGEHLAREHGWQ